MSAVVVGRPRSSRGSTVAATTVTDLAALAVVPILVIVGVRLASPLVAVTGPLVMVLALAEIRRRRRWRADLARADALPAVADHLIQRLRSGASLSLACRTSRPELGPLNTVSEALEGGATLAEASRLIGQDTDPSLRLLGTTLRLLALNGGPAVPALRRLRHTLVGRAHRRRRSQAQAASALASATMLALAPALFALVLAGTEPALARFYLQDPLGAACATGSVGLSAVGWWWIHHQVASIRSADR